MSSTRRPAAIGALLVSVAAAIALVPSAAGADVRGVEEGWVEPFPISETVGVDFSFEVSGDLTTAVFAECDSGAVTFVDLATGVSESVSGTPTATNCDRALEGGGPEPEPPYGVALHAVAEDGSALISASWEGLEAGDADGGTTDAILIDRTTGDRTLLSGPIDADWVQGVAIADDASRAILLTQDDQPPYEQSLFLWDEGAISAIGLPTGAVVEPGTHDILMSGSGRYAFVPVVSSGELLRIDLDTDATISTTLDAQCCGVSEIAVSFDGSTAAWMGPPDGDDIFVSKLTVWDMNTKRVFDIDDRPLQTSPIHITDDNTRVLGTSRFPNGDPSNGWRGYSFWSLDVATGDLDIVIDEGPNGGPSMRVKAIAPDGRRAVVSTMGPVGFEPADPRIVQFGRIATRQYLWDADLVTPSHPGADPSLAGRIERLYRAFLLRPSDTAGRTHWVDAVLGGASVTAVADAFSVSPEFTQRYGQLDDAAFIDALYRNVFDRTPDPEGAAYWNGLLTAGVSRGAVVTAMSDGAEFIDRTGTAPPRPGDEAALRRLYAAYFMRESDTVGLDYWLGQIRSVATLEAVSDAFVDSAEFDQRYGEVSNDQFIAIVYLNVLGRYPDSVGWSYWRGQLDQGATRGKLMVAFSQSAEYVGLTTLR